MGSSYKLWKIPKASRINCKENSQKEYNAEKQEVSLVINKIIFIAKIVKFYILTCKMKKKNSATKTFTAGNTV